MRYLSTKHLRERAFRCGTTELIGRQLGHAHLSHNNGNSLQSQIPLLLSDSLDVGQVRMSHLQSPTSSHLNLFKTVRVYSHISHILFDTRQIMTVVNANQYLTKSNRITQFTYPTDPSTVLHSFLSSPTPIRLADPLPTCCLYPARPTPSTLF